MKKIKEAQNREKKSMNIGLLITFVLALIIVSLGYVVMIKVEKNILTQYEKENICVVKNEIAENTSLTEENIANYVELIDIDKSITPQDAIVDVTSLYGKSLRIAVKPGTPITNSMIYSVNEIYANMENPKELSLSMSDLAQGVSGVIRTGDFIDIYILEKVSYSFSLSEAEMQQQINFAEPILKHVYVSGAFDANGVAISNDNKEAVCQRINVVTEESDAKEIYDKILNGYVYVIKDITSNDQ